MESKGRGAGRRVMIRDVRLSSTPSLIPPVRMYQFTPPSAMGVSGSIRADAERGGGSLERRTEAKAWTLDDVARFELGRALSAEGYEPARTEGSPAEPLRPLVISGALFRAAGKMLVHMPHSVGLVEGGSRSFSEVTPVDLEALEGGRYAMMAKGGEMEEVGPHTALIGSLGGHISYALEPLAPPLLGFNLFALIGNDETVDVETHEYTRYLLWARIARLQVIDRPVHYDVSVWLNLFVHPPSEAQLAAPLKALMRALCEYPDVSCSITGTPDTRRAAEEPGRGASSHAKGKRLDRSDPRKVVFPALGSPSPLAPFSSPPSPSPGGSSTRSFEQ